MVLHYYINDNFYKIQNNNGNFYGLIIDYFYELINNNKDGVIYFIFLIYRN